MDDDLVSASQASHTLLEDPAPSDLMAHSGKSGVACNRQPSGLDWNLHVYSGPLQVPTLIGALTARPFRAS
jgi:hypothetical protein